MILLTTILVFADHLSVRRFGLHAISNCMEIVCEPETVPSSRLWKNLFNGQNLVDTNCSGCERHILTKWLLCFSFCFWTYPSRLIVWLHYGRSIFFYVFLNLFIHKGVPVFFSCIATSSYKENVIRIDKMTTYKLIVVVTFTLTSWTVIVLNIFSHTKLIPYISFIKIELKAVIQCFIKGAILDTEGNIFVEKTKYEIWLGNTEQSVINGSLVYQWHVVLKDCNILQTMPCLKGVTYFKRSEVLIKMSTRCSEQFWSLKQHNNNVRAYVNENVEATLQYRS